MASRHLVFYKQLKDNIYFSVRILGVTRFVLIVELMYVVMLDSRGMLARVVNSKGVKRLPNSVKLADAVKTNNELFVDFVQHCLV